MALRSSVINKGNQNSSKIDPRLDLKGLSENEFNSLNLSEPTIKNPSLFKTFESGKSQITSESTTIDPTVLGLRNQGLSSVDTSLSNLRADREKTIGDRGTFVERRTSGLRDTLATQKEQLGMRLEQTGVTGEFGKQTKENFAASAKQKLATGQQLAVDELASISDQFDRTEGNLLKLRDSIDFSKFTQDLQARGLSQDLLNQLTRLDQGRIGRNQAQEAQDKADAGNMLLLLSQLFGS